ncbi:hypothetical protein [Mycobacteroides abscessus]|uniref:hypothetical protein n=1 Tax=Mycobacteroides abscessus TaxID=36809 RepID=UPI0009A7E09C|nr:hypothetical protein [Mycobacteroides abscessus]SLC86582.1 Uncharacterised protein [Mycobacteroides abscessus subsp. abscessus]SLG75848.1 Uncharacterised protein [Mycobacteroides abscessus subsp. abscessus]
MNAQRAVTTVGPTSALRTDLAQTLAQARSALAESASVMRPWYSPGANDDDYCLAWDVNPLVIQAITTVSNLATVHDLPITEGIEHSGQVGSGPMALHPHLRDAYAELMHAAAVAETLTTADHTYGAIGWDLETAIDDVLILVRDAARAAGLSGQRFWTGVL